MTSYILSIAEFLHSIHFITVSVDHQNILATDQYLISVVPLMYYIIQSDNANNNVKKTPFLISVISITLWTNNSMQSMYHTHKRTQEGMESHIGLCVTHLQ